MRKCLLLLMGELFVLVGDDCTRTNAGLTRETTGIIGRGLRGFFELEWSIIILIRI